MFVFVGIWCSKLIPEGRIFGPFVGKKTTEANAGMDPTFVWEVSGIKNTWPNVGIDLTIVRQATHAPKS